MAELPESGWDNVMRTNVKAVLCLTEQLLPLLEAKATTEDPALVISIGSIDGVRSSVLDGCKVLCFSSDGVGF